MGCRDSQAGETVPVAQALATPLPVTVVTTDESSTLSAGQAVTRTSVAEAAMPTPTTPSPTVTPTMTPTRGPMPIPTLDSQPYGLHTVSSGETLGYIASSYNLDLETLIQLNGLSGPSAIIRIGQSLRVPLSDDIPQATLDGYWPDSEVVYSPAYVDFDVATFVAAQEGYLNEYTQLVDGRELTGPEIIELVSERFSVGPRILLTILEHYGGWLSTPNSGELARQYPMGPRNPRGENLYLSLGWTAKKINEGYYDYKRQGFFVFFLADYSRALAPAGLNAGTVGMQNLAALHTSVDAWQAETQALLKTYQSLFGSMIEYELDIVVPASLTQPELALPWAPGEGFYLTSGPHPAYIEGSGWAAVDFGPPDVLGNCFYSNVPNTASADGVILTARKGEVQLDLDGDGNIQTGWVLFYLHVALDVDTPVTVGQQVQTGDVIGYASCEGGLSNASHLHFARRYNGEWIDAGGPVPLNLSGWVVQPSFVPYQGEMINRTETRESCECWDSAKNLIVHE